MDAGTYPRHRRTKTLNTENRTHTKIQEMEIDCSKAGSQNNNQNKILNTKNRTQATKNKTTNTENRTQEQDNQHREQDTYN